MGFRKLRIAWSAMWGVVSLLLIALWMRSYWWLDAVSLPTTGTTFLNSFDGEIGAVSWSRDVFPSGPSGWGLTSTSAKIIRRHMDAQRNRTGVQAMQTSSWHFHLGRRDPAVGFPHWFLVLVCFTFSALPWMLRHFSLRTLLIATTLLALLLGLAICAAGK